jgi:hypothetical protein
MSKRTMAVALMLPLFAMAHPLLAQQHIESGKTIVAAGGVKPDATGASQEAPQLSPEQKMQRRFPQPARAGDLIGLPVLDWGDRTIGRIKFIVRTKADKIQLVINNGGFLGWGQRLVAVPIEVVAIAGRQLSALDMTWAEIDAAPAWKNELTSPVGPDEIIQVALYKR